MVKSSRSGSLIVFGMMFGMTAHLNAQGSPVLRHPTISVHYPGNTVELHAYRVRLCNTAYQPAFVRHRAYGGHWNYGGYGSVRVAERSGTSPYPLGWGMGAWGLGALAYESGYLAYSNPYYPGAGGTFGYYNYSQPIPVNYTNPYGVAGTTDAIECAASLRAAIGAFKQTNYDAALDLINRAIIICPDDSVLHEFRALILFTTGNYQRSAAGLHPVLAIGPGWNWSTLAGMYINVSDYTAQLRALEAFCADHPSDAASRFLLAYHYMVTGYPDAAAGQLKKVVTLKPADRLAAELLRMLMTTDEEQESVSAGPTPEPYDNSDAASSPSPQNVDAGSLQGTWNAQRSDGSKFELTLAKDSTFVWRFTQSRQPHQFSGTYQVDGNILALERTRGGSLVAHLAPHGDRGFQFVLIGAPRDDAGLIFTR